VRSSDLYLELQSRLRSDLAAQPDKPDESPDATLDALWLCALGYPCSARLAPAVELSDLSPDQTVNLRRLVECRLGGMPLAHLTERQHFMGLELLAGPGALVPRVETEILARAALDIVTGLHSTVQRPRILDVCTGSGNVALAVANHLSAAVVGGCDLSESAIALARDNAAHAGLLERVEFRQGDLLAPFRDDDWTGKVDLLTCNPPYISSSKVPDMAPEIAGHEPVLAFDGGPFGVSILMRLVKEAPDMLQPEGWISFEVGRGQGPAMEKRLKMSGHFRNITPHCDNDGQMRAISAQRAQG
jgi:release factor glutamine methyltransferase